jgi:hypothetical protein
MAGIILALLGMLGLTAVAFEHSFVHGCIALMFLGALVTTIELLP